MLLLPLMLMEKELVDIQLSSTGLLVLPSFALICVYLLRQLEHVIMTIASNGDALTGAHMSKAIRRGDEEAKRMCKSRKPQTVCLPCQRLTSSRGLAKVIRSPGLTARAWNASDGRI